MTAFFAASRDASRQDVKRFERPLRMIIVACLLATRVGSASAEATTGPHAAAYLVSHF